MNNNLKNVCSKQFAHKFNKLGLKIAVLLLLFSILSFTFNQFVYAVEDTEKPSESVSETTEDSDPVSTETDPPQTDPAPTTQPEVTTTPSSAPSNGNGEKPPAGEPYVLLGENSIITGNIGQTIKLSLPLVNLGTGAAVGINAMPVLASEGDQFPFEIEKSQYIASLSNNLEPIKQLNQIKANTQVLDFGNFQIRENLNSGYYRITFKINYRSVDSGSSEQIERYLFIKVINPDQGTSGITEPTPDPGNSFDPDGLSGFGDYSSGAANGLTDENKSIPRLLCTGFTTNPEKVFGGNNFIIKLKIKNTSKELGVKNVKLTLSSLSDATPVFMPVSGASTIFIEKIEKDTEAEVEVKLKSNATIEQKAYPLDLKFEYEDSKGNPFTAEEVISIMVFQELRFDLGKMQIMPDSIEVGSEANVMFSVFNKGKATLYNLSIVLPKDGVIEDNEIFVGNLESGNSKDVDFMIKALKANPSDPIPFKISFEDAEGNVTSIDKEISLVINEENSNDFGDPFGPDMEDFPNMEENGQTKGFPWWGWLAMGLGGIILTVVIVKIMKSQKLKKEQAEIDEMV